MNVRRWLQSWIGLILSSSVLLGSGSAPLAAMAATPGESPAGPASYAQTGVFVQNPGQFDPQVRFQLRGAGGTWWFTEEGVWLTVLKQDDGPWTMDHGRQSPDRLSSIVRRPDLPQDPRRGASGVNLHLTFPGMSPAARLVPTDPQPGKMNYFLGADPARWHPNTPTYSSLVWHDLYPGVDLVFGAEWRLNANLLRQDTRRGESPISNLHLHIDGADGLRLGESGQLIADTAIGPVALPVLRSAGGQALRPAPSGNEVTFSADPAALPAPFSSAMIQRPGGFSLPVHNPSQLLASTYLGGFDDDYLTGLARGADGSLFVTGYTFSFNFPSTPGAFQPDCTPDQYTGVCSDAFVSRLNAAGTALLYSTFLGGSSFEEGIGSLAVDAQGEAYVTGETASSDFPTTPGAYDTTLGATGADAYITKLSADGSALVYSTHLGGDRGGECGSYGSELTGCYITLGSDGSAYVTGTTNASDFPTTPGAYDPICGTDGLCNPDLYGVPQADLFVTRLNPSGSGLIFSTFIGGSGGDGAGGIAVGPDGSVYLAGSTRSSDFPTTPGAYDPTCGTDGLCNASRGVRGADTFVTRLSADGSALISSTFLGGSDLDTAFGVALGSDGSMYVAGLTTSTDFPTTPGVFQPACTPIPDYELCSAAFVTRLAGDGQSLVYSTYLGGSQETSATGVLAMAVVHSSPSLPEGAVFVAGITGEADFPTTANAFDRTCGLGGQCDPDVNGTSYADAFLSELSPTGDRLLYSTFLGGGHTDSAAGLALDPHGGVYVAGWTASLQFPTTPGAYDRRLNGGFDGGDAFVSELDPGLPVLRVARLEADYRQSGGRYRVVVGAVIRDVRGDLVPGAAVQIEVRRPDGRTARVSRRTDGQGRVQLTFTTAQTGTYMFTVTNMTKPGAVYNAWISRETSVTLTIP